MEHVDVGGLQVAYRRLGAGTPLVLLHGAVSDGRVWRVELERFSDGFDVIAWDAPGCGGSADPPPAFRMGDYADVLAGLLGALGVGPAHVLGHSWGSTVALDLALRHPATVRSLVLVGAYAGWAGSLPPDEVQRRLDFALQAAEAGTWDPRSMPGLFSEALPAERAEELAAVMAESRGAATATMARALAEADLRADLGRVAVPTLLVYGDADARASLEVATALHEAIPDSELTVLPGLGHECYLESPEAFEAAVRAFLTHA